MNNRRLRPCGAGAMLLWGSRGRTAVFLHGQRPCGAGGGLVGAAADSMSGSRGARKGLEDVSWRHVGRDDVWVGLGARGECDYDYGSVREWVEHAVRMDREVWLRFRVPVLRHAVL